MDGWCKGVGQENMQSTEEKKSKNENDSMTVTIQSRKRGRIIQIINKWDKNYSYLNL